VIHVTQGTVANERASLIGPTLAALADQEALVVVSTGGRAPAEMGLGALPGNARVATYLSYPELLPRTAAMVTNGGYGGTQLGLAHGLPVVVAGTTEDKLEVTARVAWAGVGINLRTDTPTAARIRDAVGQVLSDPSYRRRAQALQAEYARYDAVALGTELLERLAATGRPVLRTASEQARPATALASAPAYGGEQWH
jgi:UDP:flavonoid glycosyltransferase YjiC (YdhE family)